MKDMKVQMKVTAISGIILTENKLQLFLNDHWCIGVLSVLERYVTVCVQTCFNSGFLSRRRQGRATSLAGNSSTKRWTSWKLSSQAVVKKSPVPPDNWWMLPAFACRGLETYDLKPFQTWILVDLQKGLQSKRILKYPWVNGILKSCDWSLPQIRQLWSGHDSTVKIQIVMTVKRIVYGAVRCCYWKSDISRIGVPHLDTQPLWCRFFKECTVTVNLCCLWLDETQQKIHSMLTLANSSASTLVLPNLNYMILFVIWCNL